MKAKMGDVGVLLLVGGLGLVGYAILSRPKPVGETTLSMVVKERVITGAYQACRKECALRFWLAKTVFCSQTNGRITDLRFRYRLEYEHDTSAFQDIYSCAPLLAAWVSPADPPVARIAAAAKLQAVGLRRIDNDEDCKKVMAALYEMMRAIRISYQGARAVKDPRMSFHVKDVQSIQYPRDTVWTRRGTCVELAVLYASLLGSVGIEPLLLIKDEHCFTMARLPKSKQPFAVETQGAAGGLPGLPEWQTVDFNRACKMGEEQWTEVQKNGRFVQVDVRDCWQKGILPPKLEALPPAELKGAEILERSDAQREGASAAKSAVARYLEMLIPHACVASQQPMPKAPPAPPTTPPPAA